MATTLKKMLKQLPARRRKKIAARAAALIAEEMSLRGLRKTLAVTQEEIARLLDVGQDSVSRAEARNDLLVSTLRAFVGALGGKLRLLVEFPDRPPVALPETLGNDGKANRGKTGKSGDL